MPFLALLAFLALMSGANSGPTIENIEREKGNEWRKKRGLRRNERLRKKKTKKRK